MATGTAVTVQAINCLPGHWWPFFVCICYKEYSTIQITRAIKINTPSKKISHVN